LPSLLSSQAAISVGGGRASDIESRLSLTPGGGWLFCRLPVLPRSLLERSSISMREIYCIWEDGRIMEVLNWMQRKSGDCIVWRSLKEGDKRKYYTLRNLGLSDSQIFFSLNPNLFDRIGERKTVKVPMEILDKKQLIWLLEDKIGEKMKSLDKLSKRDLVRLFLALSK
jgi:hypothetical protein